MSTEERILLVEDNQVETLGLTHSLNELGYSVDTARDAVQAITALREKKPDLVILDVNLPVLVPFDSPKWDGLDFLEWMHSMTDSHIPVIILTGTSLGKAAQLRLSHARVAAQFEKPPNVNDLMAAVRSALDTAQDASEQAVSG
jgi:CheY-like chemotaxis protein